MQKFKHGPNNYIEIDDKTLGIEVFSKGEKFICLIDKEDYPRVKHFRWTLSGVTKKNRTRYLRTHPHRVGPSEGWVLILHHLILSFPEGKQIDHINRNGLDNRKSNLREATHLENARNKVYERKANSGFLGVVPNKSKKRPWKVYISHFKQSIYLGSYETKEEAALAYDRKAIELRGEFAVLNFPHAA